ncbi:MAG: GNAT family N-acetyltransferase [Acutalibacteraceae bacterium]
MNIVRKIEASELSALTALFKYKDVNEMIAENARDIENGTIDIFALFCDDKLIGELRVKYISDDVRFAEKGKRAYLYAFRIHKKFQDKSLGKYLLENVLDLLKENGYCEFTVGVEDDNLKARHIYEKYGFTETVARIKESYQGDSYEYNLLLKKPNN